MADIPGSIIKINDIEVSANAPLSESYNLKLGSTINGLVDQGNTNAANIATNASDIATLQNLVSDSTLVTVNLTAGIGVTDQRVTLDAAFNANNKTVIFLALNGSVTFNGGTTPGGVPKGVIKRNGADAITLASSGQSGSLSFSFSQLLATSLGTGNGSPGATVLGIDQPGAGTFNYELSLSGSTGSSNSVNGLQILIFAV